MKGKSIVVGITGGIAAFKAASIVSDLAKRGADVHVIMTKSATEFITPLTMQVLSKNHALIDTFDERNPKNVLHINVADNADLVVVVPATANVIAKMAYGIADDLLTTTLLAVKCPILIAPAMNVNMYHHPTVQQNMKILSSRGVKFIEPVEGMLAEGYAGKGRLPEPEDIVKYIEDFLNQAKDLSGHKFLITAGATREAVDPVRFFTNRSSGKMGYALAEAAVERGAEVVLVSGKTSITPPAGVKLITTESAEEMYQAVMENLSEAEIIIKAAAVADYRPKEVHRQKFKKTDGPWVIEMERTKDIAYEVGRTKTTNQFLVGFAAETDQLIERATDKLIKKNMDMIVANHVLTEGAGFELDTNIVTLVTKAGEEINYSLMSKKELANRILTEIKHRLGGI